MNLKKLLVAGILSLALIGFVGCEVEDEPMEEPIEEDMEDPAD
ncbi:hypothetical protein [Isachenkonia alkalipeptolytica]|nr:hypothetical protein [Isachenkonia alkalipeptolytica]